MKRPAKQSRKVGAKADELVSADELAGVLGILPQQVYRLRVRGKLPSRKTRAGWRFPRAASIAAHRALLAAVESRRGIPVSLLDAKKSRLMVRIALTEDEEAETAASLVASSLARERFDALFAQLRAGAVDEMQAWPAQLHGLGTTSVAYHRLEGLRNDLMARLTPPDAAPARVAAVLDEPGPVAPVASTPVDGAAAATLDALRARLLASQTRLAEMKLGRRRRDLVTVAAYRAWLGHAVDAARAALLALPVRYAAAFAGKWQDGTLAALKADVLTALTPPPFDARKAA